MRWRQGTRLYWARRKGLLNRWGGDKALGDGEDEWGPEATEMLELVACGGLNIERDEDCISTDDVGKVVGFQVERAICRVSLIRGSVAL